MPSIELRWDAPVVYLSEYPASTQVSGYGVPFYVCERCGGRLVALADTGGKGTMPVCVYRCGHGLSVAPVP